MAATASQISEIRLLSGDNASSSAKYVVTDAQVNIWYDDVGSICGVVYKVLQSMLADAARNLGGSGDATAGNAKVQQVQTLMTIVKGDCPEARQATGTFSINLGIDEETELVDIE